MLLLALIAGCATPPPDLVLVVLDNVRADHLSACGQERPTTPVIDGLVAQGASLSCRGVSPGAWTVPAHASLFTGVPVSEHGAHATSGGVALQEGWLDLAPLDHTLPVLAEELSHSHRTALLSGNPLLSEATGLSRGFEEVVVASTFEEAREERLLELGQSMLEREDERPLFLVVNISDAHPPWPGVPEGVEWLPERPGLGFSLANDTLWYRYTMGLTSPEAAREGLAHMGDVYAWGVHRADRTLGQLLQALDEARPGRARRLVLTSDHGEQLGEHGLLGHCCNVWEATVRVPLLVAQWDRRGHLAAPALPEPVSTLQVHPLLLQGALRTDLPPRSEAFAFSSWVSATGGQVNAHAWAGVWEGEDKLTWTSEGERVQAWRPGEEPEEVLARPGAGHALEARLEPVIQQVREASEREGRAEDIQSLLEAAGYVEPPRPP